jgi:glycosyltransferase involved in cell wall biosynthesis
MPVTPPSPEELREEIDRLRRERQRLRIEAADAQARALSLRASVTHAALLAGGRTLGALRHLVARRRATGTPGAAHVEPYRVRQHGATRPDRPRVLHVIANFHLGGSARLVVDLVEGLGHAWEQSAVSWLLPPTPAYVGIDVAHHPGRSVDDALRVLSARRPAMIHVHYLGHHDDKYGIRDWEWYRHWFAAAERAGIPVIENVNIPTEPFVSDAVACYVHVSDYVRERYGRRDGRHVTIYPGSDLGMFSPRDGAEPPDDCLGMVYRLARDKLDEHAVDPFIEAIRIRPNTRALIVGGGVLLEAHRRRVADAGLESSFTFAGYAEYEALPALYGRMSVFVAPVHTESFGQVSPFAMGMHLPVIGYDVGAIPEIVGDASLIAPAGDSRRLGEIAAALLDDRPRRLGIGEANRRRAERLFSVEAMIAAYEALYRELAPLPAQHAERGAP